MEKRDDIVPAYSNRKWTKFELIEKALKKLQEENPSEWIFELPIEVFEAEIKGIHKYGVLYFR